MRFFRFSLETLNWKRVETFQNESKSSDWCRLICEHWRNRMCVSAWVRINNLPDLWIKCVKCFWPAVDQRSRCHCLFCLWFSDGRTGRRSVDSWTAVWPRARPLQKHSWFRTRTKARGCPEGRRDERGLTEFHGLFSTCLIMWCRTSWTDVSCWKLGKLIMIIANRNGKNCHSGNQSANGSSQLLVRFCLLALASSSISNRVCLHQQGFILVQFWHLLRE